MPRVETTELGLKCVNCREYTQTIKPIIFKKVKENRIIMKGSCCICNRIKTKTLNHLQRILLPEEIRTLENGKEVANEITRNGGLLPLPILIPLILGGITALSSTAG